MITAANEAALAAKKATGCGFGNPHNLAQAGISDGGPERRRRRFVERLSACRQTLGRRGHNSPSAMRISANRRGLNPHAADRIHSRLPISGPVWRVCIGGNIGSHRSSRDDPRGNGPTGPADQVWCEAYRRAPCASGLTQFDPSATWTLRQAAASWRLLKRNLWRRYSHAGPKLAITAIRRDGALAPDAVQT